MKVTTEKGMRIKIRNVLTGLGIYREEFEWEIEMLAELFIRREQTKEAFRKSGGAAIIKQTNKGGNSYAVKNPLLAEIDFVEKRIIELAREMGMTPSAVKKLNEAAIGKIAGEQLTKLMTLGLTEAEAEEQIINGFLK